MPRASKTKFFALALLTVSLAMFAAPRQFFAAVTSPREVSVVVLPFEVNAGDDLKYLRQSLPDLLSDRLREAGFSVVGKDALEKALASKGLKATDPQAVREGGAPDRSHLRHLRQFQPVGRNPVHRRPRHRSLRPQAPGARVRHP